MKIMEGQHGDISNRTMGDLPSQTIGTVEHEPIEDDGVVLVNGAARAYHFALDEYVHYTARGNAIGGAGNAVVTDIARGRRAPHALVAVVLRAYGVEHASRVITEVEHPHGELIPVGVGVGVRRGGCGEATALA